MKKLLFTVILCLTTSIICMGQDVHLQQLTQGVISLRKAASKARNTLVADWSREQMPKITLMDDIGRVPSEARGKGCNPFMLNQVVTYVYSRQNTSMSSKGDYFNSTEKDIYYSAIEKTVKPHQTATYTLSGHIGHQQFMFITFNPKAKVAFSVNGHPGRDQGNGVTFVDLGQVSKRDVITISITNHSTKAESFVILNHNPQRR